MWVGGGKMGGMRSGARRRIRGALVDGGMDGFDALSLDDGAVRMEICYVPAIPHVPLHHRRTLPPRRAHRESKTTTHCGAGALCTPASNLAGMTVTLPPSKPPNANVAAPTVPAVEEVLNGVVKRQHWKAELFCGVV